MRKKYFVSYAYQMSNGNSGFGNLEANRPTIKGIDDVTDLARKISEDTGFKNVVILFYKVI